MEVKENESVFEVKERHELRKQLKLLMISNMKMKKQLRVTMRGRHLNRMRLEKDVRELNEVAHSVAAKVLDHAQMNVVNDRTQFTNPLQISTDYLPLTKKQSAPPSHYRFFCDVCPFRSKARPPLEVHKMRHARLRPFPCGECPKAFVTRGELKIHAGRHNNEKMFACDLCSFVTHNSYVLSTHKERIHQSFRVYSCSLDKCDFSTNDRCEWNKHKSDNPTHNKHPKCLACLVARERLKTNVGTVRDELHTCEKPWGCRQCGLRFQRKDSLQMHERRHSEEKRYHCDDCEYATHNKHSLVVHRRTHSGEKPFLCSVCPFSCTTRSYLTIHMNQHAGVTPYGCDVCSFKSANPSRVSSHRRGAHRGGRGAHRNGEGGRWVKGNMCKSCGRMFHTLGAMLRHEKEHNANAIV